VNEENKTPARLSSIQSRMKKALLERLEPKRLADDVDALAKNFLTNHVQHILAVAFGFEKRWSDGFELHKGFTEGALHARLQQFVTSDATMQFLEEAIGNFKDHVKPKDLKAWQKRYREAFLEAYWERAGELINVRGEHDGRAQADLYFNQLMREHFAAAAELPEGHPLRDKVVDDDDACDDADDVDDQDGGA
jgi:hypothetical protein